MLIGQAPQSLVHGGGGVGTISSHGVLVTINVSAPKVQRHLRDGVKQQDGPMQIFFVTLFSDTQQDAHWVHGHWQQVRHELEHVFGFRTTQLHVWSDNCQEQYKCRASMARLAAMDVPVTLNFFQAGHGKSYVDCCTSVWRHVTDQYNAQNLQQQLTSPKQIVQHWQQHHKLSKGSVLHRMVFQLLDGEVVAAERSKAIWQQAAKCPGIAAAHSFQLQQPCPEDVSRVRIQVAGLSGYCKPDGCNRARFSAYRALGMPRPTTG